MRVREKHSLTLRLVHWLNVPLLALMIWSGLLIYWATDPYYWPFFPKWFFELLDIPSRLAEGMAIHFSIGWLFIINGLIYLSWVLLSGHWRHLKPSLEKNGYFNRSQRVAYSGVIVLAILGVLSGFAIYKPVQLSWLSALFGGYKGARFVHFVVMISLCLFIFVHIVQVIRAGWNTFRAMVAGFEVERD